MVVWDGPRCVSCGDMLLSPWWERRRAPRAAQVLLDAENIFGRRNAIVSRPLQTEIDDCRAPRNADRAYSLGDQTPPKGPR
jgi:hypothetical protein